MVVRNSVSHLQPNHVLTAQYNCCLVCASCAMTPQTCSQNKTSGMSTEDHPCRWFHFRLTGVQNQALVVNLVNAGQSSFPEAWPGYRACASYDLKDWFRVQTAWDEKAGVITMQHKSNHVRQTPDVSTLSLHHIHSTEPLRAAEQTASGYRGSSYDGPSRTFFSSSFFPFFLCFALTFLLFSVHCFRATHHQGA